MTPDQVREWRIKRGWTQAQLAKMMGYKDRSSVCRMENGKRKIRGPVLFALKRILRVDR